MSEISGIQADPAHIAGHFFSDPKAKYILSCDGKLICKNLEGKKLLERGVLNCLNDNTLSYGSPDLNASACEILQAVRIGRSSHMRLLKRYEDDWITLDFSTAENNDRKEVLLTVRRQGPCLDDSLRALCKAFHFTITEAEVVKHMTMAFCPKEIGARMGISINTVRAHLRSIYGKLGARGYNQSLRVILKLVN